MDTIHMEPIGVVRNGVTEAVDEGWLGRLFRATWAPLLPPVLRWWHVALAGLRLNWGAQ